MGMTVIAVGGIGIVFAAADATVEEEVYFDGFWPAQGLVCREIGAYSDDRMFFLGAGAAVGWNDGVSGEPVKLPDTDTIRTMITDFLASENMPHLFKEESFGLHVYPYVS